MCVCARVGVYTLLAEEKLILSSFKGKGQVTNKGKAGSGEILLRALAISYTVCCSYLYRNSFFVFSSFNFVFFFFLVFFVYFQTCEALGWATLCCEKGGLKKESFVLFFSFLPDLEFSLEKNNQMYIEM